MKDRIILALFFSPRKYHTFPWNLEADKLANCSVPQKQDFKLLVTDSQQLHFLAIG